MNKSTGDLIAVVDENDNVTGYKDKMEVHEKGILHRAFSVFVFNENNEMLLQKRASVKYHSPGLWTNTCCSHLLPDKTMELCAHERLNFEMGFDCEIEKSFTFHYKASFDNNLTENEIDHVYIGKYSGVVVPNKDEVEDFKWISISDLKESIEQDPDEYTYWFKYIIEKYSDDMTL